MVIKGVERAFVYNIENSDAANELSVCSCLNVPSFSAEVCARR